MNLCYKIYAAFFGITYSLIVAAVSSDFLESKMCLEQVLAIHSVMKQKQCPVSLLNSFSGFEECSVLCEGRVTNKNKLYDEEHCIGFEIDFHLNDTLSTRLKDFPCNISQCIVEVIKFECWFQTNITDTAINNSSSNKNQTNGEENQCSAAASTVIISLSCSALGIIFGICFFVITKRIRKYKQRLDPTAVFYQSNDGEELEIVTVSNPMETEYADIEESIKMISKAVQVPSYKEDSSSESRSRENIYHHLSLIEQSQKIEKSVLNPGDFVSSTSSYDDATRLSSAGSQSVKSGVINTESLSSKSNNSPKASRTGSDDSDKYFALEEHDYLNSISNDKSS